MRADSINPHLCNRASCRPSRDGAFDLKLMRLIDEQHLKTPWYGSRQMKRYFRRQGLQVNRKRIRHLIRQIGLVAVAPASI